MKTRGGDELVDLCAIVRHKTERAVLIVHALEKAPVWIPLAHAELIPNEDGRTHTVTIPQWLAEEKGIV